MPDILLLAEVDQRIQLILLLLATLSLLLIILSIRRLLQKKPFRASFYSLNAIVFLALLVIFASISLNFHTYDRLSHEEVIARLHFTELDHQTFKLVINYTNQQQQEFSLNGDEWQIDARIIKWSPQAQLLGLDALYRLERISGRYADIEQEKTEQRSVHSLGARDNMDYWRMIREHQKWLPWVDAYFGSAAYLPMANDASYALSITQSGLIARPLDDNTKQMIKGW